MVEYKEAEAFLMQVRRIEEHIMEDKRRDAWEQATRITSRRTDITRVHGGELHRGGELYAELSEQCTRELIRLNHVKAVTLAVIGRVEDNTLACLLTGYYVMGKTWAQTAEIIGYSFKHTISNLRGQAIAAFAEVLKYSESRGV